MMHGLAIEDGMETIRAAIAETRSKYNLQQLGITGYCMGGTFALRAACEVSELAAAAPFYGDIPEEDVLQRLRVPTLFIAGKKDAWINTEKVGALKQPRSGTNFRWRWLVTTLITPSLTTRVRKSTMRMLRPTPGDVC